MKNGNGTNSMSSIESDSEFDRITLVKSTNKKSRLGDESASTESRGSGSASVTSSKITSLSKVRANQNQY
jgi:hypothetical protein